MTAPSPEHGLPVSQTRSVKRTILTYASGRVYRQCLGLLTSVARPKLLPEEFFGFWTLIRTILDYSQYHHLGARTIARYRIPFHQSRDEHDEANALANTTYAFSVIILVCLAMVLAVIAIFIKAPIELRVGLAATAIMVLCQGVYEYYVTMLRAVQRFSLITGLQYLRATASLLLTILLIYFLGVYGLYLSVIMTTAVLLVWIRTRFAYRPRSQLDYRRFLRLVRLGWPVMATGLAFVLQASIDRFVVLGFLGSKQLGYYGIAVLAFGFIRQIPGAAREVMEPRMMHAISDDRTVAIGEHFLHPLTRLAYGLPFVVGPAFFLLPPVIELVLPRYVPGILSAQVLVLAAYFAGLNYLPRMAIVACDWQLSALMLMPVVLLLNLAAAIVMVTRGYGISGVAAASAGSQCVLFILFLIFLSMRLQKKPTKWGLHIGGLLLASVMTTAGLFGFYAVQDRVLGSGWWPALAATAMHAVFHGIIWAAAQNTLELPSIRATVHRLRRRYAGDR